MADTDPKTAAMVAIQELGVATLEKATAIFTSVAQPDARNMALFRTDFENAMFRLNESIRLS